jgi:hypothetical protein
MFRRSLPDGVRRPNAPLLWRRRYRCTTHR